MKLVGFVFGLILICILGENEMEVIVFGFFVYYSVRFLFFLLELLVDIWSEYVSVKNRKIIRHWDWLREMGYHETGNIILKKMSTK